jgi:hypothetical protein
MNYQYFMLMVHRYTVYFQTFLIDKFFMSPRRNDDKRSMFGISYLYYIVFWWPFNSQFVKYLCLYINLIVKFLTLHKM